MDIKQDRPRNIEIKPSIQQPPPERDTIQLILDKLSRYAPSLFEVKLQDRKNFMNAFPFHFDKKTVNDKHTPVMNLCTFELDCTSPIRQIVALKKGWCALITDASVTFLAADMVSYFKHSIPNIQAISEYIVPRVEVHLLALVTPNLV